MADDWFDLTDVTDDQLVAATQVHIVGQDALLLGRSTFEAFRSLWAQQTDDTTGITDHPNRVQNCRHNTGLGAP